MFPIRKIYFFKMFPERNFAEQKGSLLRPSNRRLSVAVLFTEFILPRKSACALGKRNNRKIVIEGVLYWAFIRRTERPRQVPVNSPDTLSVSKNKVHARFL